MTSSYGVSLQFIFGVRSDIRDSLHFWDEKRVIYPAGHNVVLYDIEERTQRFYSPSEDSLAITAVATSPKRAYMAFAETQLNRGALINIYDRSQRKRRCLVSSSPSAQSVKHIAFSSDKDERQLLVLYGAPLPSLAHWPWTASKPNAVLTFDEPVEWGKCSFSPSDASVCVLTGKNLFLHMKVEEEAKTLSIQLSRIQTRDGAEPKHSRNYASHCWTAEGLLAVATDEGEVLALDSDGYFLGMSKLERRISSLAASGGGIVVGCEGPVILSMVFNRENLTEPFKEVRADSLEEVSDSVCCLAVNPSTDKVILCITADQQIFKLGATRAPQELISNFHSKAVIDMDISVRRPLMVTCSKDGTIRLWNYIESRQELKYSSPDILPLGVALHPSGLFVAVGTADKVYIMAVFLDSLRTVQEISVKQFRKVAFSNGGQYLAVSYSSSLQVYGFYGLELVSGLSVTPVKVQDLKWYEDDSGFITNDQGSHISFCVRDLAANGISVGNKQQVTAIAKIPNSQMAYAGCSDGSIKEVTATDVNKKLEVLGVPEQMAITRNAKLLFVGMGGKKQPGTVKCYKHPLSLGECTDVQAHSKSVKAMRITVDDRYLLTAGKDGCIAVYRINERESIEIRRGPRFPYGNEILTDRQQLATIQKELDGMTAKNKSLATSKTSEQEIVLSGLQQDLERINSLARQRQETYESLKATRSIKIVALSAEHDEQKKKLMQTESNEIDQLKRKHLEKLANKSTVFSRLSIELERVQKLQEEERRKLLESDELEIARLRKEYDAQINLVLESIKQKNKELESKIDKQTQIMEQMKKDHETEVGLEESEHDRKVREENKLLTKARGDYQTNSNRIDECRRHVEELSRDIKELKDLMDRTGREKESITAEIRSLNRVMSEKSKAIATFEHEIYLYKKKVQNLEKFKFVLDYKIKEKKREITPCQKEVEERREKAAKKDEKLKKFNKLNIFLGYRLKELEETRKVLLSEIVNNREKLRKHIVRRKEMFDNLTHCVQLIHMPDKLREAVAEKLGGYRKKGEQLDRLMPDIKAEFANQEGYLVNAVKTLEQELKLKQKTRRENNRMLRNQNKVLITEIQRMRGVMSKSKGPGNARRGRGYSHFKNLDNSMITYSSKMDISDSNYSSPMIKPSYKSPLVKSELAKAVPIDSPVISSPAFCLAKDEAENRPESFEQNKETIRVLRERIEVVKRENEELRTVKGFAL